MDISLINAWSGVIENARKYVFAVYEPLARDFQTTAGIIFMLYVVIAIFMLIKFGNREMIPKILMSFLVFAVVFQFVFTDKSQGFKDWVYKPVFETSLNLTGFFINPLSSSNNKLERMFNEFETKALDMASVADVQINEGGFFAKFSPVTWATAFVWALIFIGFIGVYFSFGIFTLIAFLGLHILLAFAPIALLLGGIPFTRHVFTSWMKSVVTFALIPPFCAVALGLTNNYVLATIDEMKLIGSQGSPFTSSTLLMLFMFVLTFLLMKKAPEFASALTGGVMTSLSGAGGAIAGAAAGYSGFAKHSKAAGLGVAATEKLGSAAGNFMKRRTGDGS